MIRSARSIRGVGSCTKSNIWKWERPFAFWRIRSRSSHGINGPATKTPVASGGNFAPRNASPSAPPSWPPPTRQRTIRPCGRFATNGSASALANSSRGRWSRYPTCRAFGNRTVELVFSNRVEDGRIAIDPDRVVVFSDRLRVRRIRPGVPHSLRVIEDISNSEDAVGVRATPQVFEGRSQFAGHSKGQVVHN